MNKSNHTLPQSRPNSVPCRQEVERGGAPAGADRPEKAVPSASVHPSMESRMNHIAPMHEPANRGEKLGVARTDLNDRIATRIEEAELSPDQEALLEKLLGQDYEVITADERLDRIAADFVEHCATRWRSGKSMMVCIDKITCARMLQLILPRWRAKDGCRTRRRRTPSVRTPRWRATSLPAPRLCGGSRGVDRPGRVAGQNHRRDSSSVRLRTRSETSRSGDSTSSRIGR